MQVLASFLALEAALATGDATCILCTRLYPPCVLPAFQPFHQNGGDSLSKSLLRCRCRCFANDHMVQASEVYLWGRRGHCSSDTKTRQQGTRLLCPCNQERHTGMRTIFMYP